MNRFASSLVLLIVTAGVSPGTGAAQDGRCRTAGASLAISLPPDAVAAPEGAA